MEADVRFGSLADICKRTFGCAKRIRGHHKVLTLSLPAFLLDHSPMELSRADQYFCSLSIWLTN